MVNILIVFNIFIWAEQVKRCCNCQQILVLFRIYATPLTHFILNSFDDYVHWSICPQKTFFPITRCQVENCKCNAFKYKYLTPLSRHRNHFVILQYFCKNQNRKKWTLLALQRVKPVIFSVSFFLF